MGSLQTQPVIFYEFLTHLWLFYWGGARMGPLTLLLCFKECLSLSDLCSFDVGQLRLSIGIMLCPLKHSGQKSLKFFLNYPNNSNNSSLLFQSDQERKRERKVSQRNKEWEGCMLRKRKKEVLIALYLLKKKIKDLPLNS